jgi:hypothetical protein
MQQKKKEIEMREKMGLWKNEWWDKECREGKQAARKELRNWKKRKSNEGRVQQSTQEVQIIMQREEGKETDGRRNEDEGYKDGRRGVEIHK